MRIALLTLAPVAALALAAESPLPSSAAEHAAMLAAFARDEAALTAALATHPDDLAALSRRGDRRLFLGRFAAAIADYERMIALDPAQDAPHWRLGIAYHLAGDFAKSSRQFEKYHAYDDRDRENGIWKFLADARTSDLETARRAMLPYTRFDREPFPALYDMFAGRKTTAEFLADLKARGLDRDERVMFFANYYAGLNEQWLGRRARALELLRLAVASPWGRTAEGGPAYMWQCARLHLEKIVAEKP
jgi:lipoprotein NlpI